MALTTSKTFSIEHPNGLREVCYAVTFDSSYPTGGETFDISAEFSGSPTVLSGIAVNATPVTIVVRHDNGTAAAGKLLAYYCDNNGGSDSGLIQIPGTTDLSAYSCSIRAIGIGA